MSIDLYKMKFNNSFVELHETGSNMYDNETDMKIFKKLLDKNDSGLIGNTEFNKVRSMIAINDILNESISILACLQS